MSWAPDGSSLPLTRRRPPERMDTRACEADSLDVEAVLEFAQRVLLEPAKMWRSASLRQRQELQQLLFPEELSWDSKGFGTAVTCCVLSHLQARAVPDAYMVAPRGFEPLLPE